MASVNWEVTFFELHTTTLDETTASLFANGRMQVAVDVFVRAIDSQNGSRYRLTQAELNTIQLVQYVNPNIVLTDPWFYSDQQNEFAHAMPSSGDTNASPASNEALPIQNDATWDHKRYWVRTTRVEHIRVAARIRQPNGTTESTNNGTSFNSFVHLTGEPPVLYNSTTIGTERDPVVTNGIHTVTVTSATTWDQYRGAWTQVNYYLYSKVYSFLRANIPGVPFGHDEANKYLHFAEADNGTNLRSHYIWELNGPSWRAAGPQQDIMFQGQTHHVRSRRDIRINQMRNALCFTILEHESRSPIWHPFWDWIPGFELLDIYGNSGLFTATHSADRRELVIRNGLPRSISAEQNDKHLSATSQDEELSKPKL